MRAAVRVSDVVLPDDAWTGVDESTQALVDRWLVEPGARVAAGQAVVRIVLVKSSIDVAAPVAGRLGSILVPAGATFARGQALSTVETID